jgi:hypothetical protein
VTITETRPVETTDPTLETVDPEMQTNAHIVRKKPLTEAYVMGLPVKALCGLEFIPCQDPERLPVCQPCKDTLAAIIAARNGDN